ncbi:MAG: hypothetical protein A3E38_02150 [Candidatus Moranbacteria bacterium RIFCSPHIGHO2_12_FULL_54_9]|nr:MAG: hypothetical protein A2878_01920 [Candidatus Moranbacteria bacterium RIFCSPHIGHO2_01_FULL_54_31]OGI25265.1 MAG: hypothetical protein A3E38_02150 [Candidatus Moranbacteria bacterium RIFCSPHIGHO2_12_FULL_54_9]
MPKNYFDEHLWGSSPQGTMAIPNPDYIPGCHRTYLIQRLRLPHEDCAAADFPGDIHSGGFSDELWNILKQFGFLEYMDAPEFEFGAVPETFQRMALAHRSLAAYTLDISGHPEFPSNERFDAYQSDELEAIRTRHMLKTTVFVLAPHFIRPHVEDTLLRIALGDEIDLRKPTRLGESVFCARHWKTGSAEARTYGKTCGWLELDNGFMFFSDEDTWRNFCDVFGLTSLAEWCTSDILEPDFSEIDKDLATCPRRDQ